MSSKIKKIIPIFILLFAVLLIKPMNSTFARESYTNYYDDIYALGNNEFFGYNKRFRNSGVCLP